MNSDPGRLVRWSKKYRHTAEGAMPISNTCPTSTYHRYAKNYVGHAIPCVRQNKEKKYFVITMSMLLVSCI